MFIIFISKVIFIQFVKINESLLGRKRIFDKSIFPSILILMIFHVLFLLSSQLSNTYGIEVVPEITILTDAKKIPLEPFVEIGDNKLTKLGFPDLPDNDNPNVIINTDKSIKVNYDNKEIKNVEGYVIDYDADVNEITPLEKMNFNEFKFPESLDNGPKTLEIRILMDNGQKISYTVLAMLQR